MTLMLITYWMKMLKKILRAVFVILFGKSRKALHGENKLHKAARENRLDKLEDLLSGDWSVNDEDEVGDTALHLAAVNGGEALVEVLLDRGADCNHRNRVGDTPLHQAVAHRRVMVASTLLRRGAAVNIPGSFGSTPLLVAVRVGSLRLVRELLGRGADIRHRDMAGRTALHIACGPGILKDRHIVSTLLVHGAPVNGRDSRGQTALHLAVQARPFNESLVQDLLDWGASMFVRDCAGKEPFELASDTVVAKYTFGEHIVKLNSAGLNYNINIASDINMVTWWSWHSACVRELTKMRLYTFDQFTIADIFTRRSDPAFLSNGRVRGAFRELTTSSDLSNEFPIFASLIKILFVRGERRLKLLDCAQHFQFPSSSAPFPNEIRRMVLSYLDDEDLRNVIRASSGRKVEDRCGCYLHLILPRYAL